MSIALTEFDNARVRVGGQGKRGRGLFARQGLADATLILRCPVKVLNPMEYQALRFIPSIRSFLASRPEHHGDGGMISLKAGIDHLFADPDVVLSALEQAESASSAIMYMFAWPRPDEDGGDTAAMAFGLTSICNHAAESAAANAVLVRDRDAEAIDLVALRDIDDGEELLISYASVPFEAV